MDKETRVTRSTGIVVANFSSPHEFNFDDGSVLPACSPARARALMLNAAEIEHAAPHGVDIELRFELNEIVRDELIRLYNFGRVEGFLVLIPLPVMQAMKAEWPHMWSHREAAPTPFRCVRTADRITKVIYHDRFCI